jgi:hypothetical protein
MKKIILLFILSLLISNLSFGQSGWIEQNSGVTVQLTSVSGTFNSAWICGYNGTVLRSTNNGSIWQNVSGNGIPNNIQLLTIAAFDNNNAVTAGNVGSNTYVYRTSNAGVTWTQVFSQTNGFIDAIDNSYGFMVGNPVAGRWSLWKTTNSGANWDSTGMYLAQTGTETGWSNSLYRFQNYIWFGTNNSRIYYSTNNGSNWSVQSTGSEVNIYAIWFMYSDFTDGLAGGSTLMITSNGGTNWNPQVSIGTGNFSGFTGGLYPVNNITNLQLTWYVRNDSKIYFSQMNATNWIVDFTSTAGTYSYIKNIGINGPFFAVRNNGGITYHSAITGIQKISNEVPNKFSLLQNYPNPFNPTTKIKIDIPPFTKGGLGGFVQLKIYDLLGREVTTLINEQLKPGSYEAEWDGSNFASGIYFYSLVADEYTQTKKMVLIK